MSNTNPVTVESINPQDEKLEALRSLFPEAFREGKLDTTLLSATLGESISNERESYGMSWAGKSDARKQIVTPTTKSLSPDEVSSVDFANTDNILIEGDNLEVLKLLQKSYAKQVKMIYIDPPYNTGKDFVYHDNFHTSTAEYEEASGQRDSEGAKLVQNTETNGRYHSDWLSMIYPRLHLARNLLRNDGVIFVSIDDNEVHNLRKVMDEVFGEENFVATIMWKRKKEISNDSKNVAIQGEYILVYSKSEQGLIQLEDLSEKYIESSYNEPTKEFSLGKWRPVPITVSKGLKGGGYSYSIETPSGKTHERVWAYPEHSYKELLKEGRVYFGKSNDGIPQRVIYESESLGKPTSNYWDDVATNKEGKKEILEIFGDNYFDTPKPTKLILKILDLSTNSNDLILDFFAGSGTSGHAVMLLNNEEKMEAVKNGEDPSIVGNRQYICVQLDEATDEKSEAFKAGYAKISEITADRLRRAGKKIKEENPSVSFDNGFRLYRLTPSCYQVASVEYDSEDTQTTLESLERAIQSGISPLRDGVTQADVIVENLIKEGFLLNSRFENIQIGDNQFLHAEREGKQLYMSFESDIAMSTIQSLSKDYSEAIFVVHDNALDDSRKVMMSDRVKLRTI